MDKWVLASFLLALVIVISITISPAIYLALQARP